ncbi:LysR family transcriptional regulator [Pyxidicoccus parkwayensis]|uniref:LysR family transcriptional regulator n=1 Tax=Pyxidicoccus parkwayensis TaxID=2813578 RepID=A0ABX7NWS0_9BACT|nr:LysR family transcriptional regulator [Pyxidicoccus parkwaysis]QSQ23163.1 LysR family transcriptional regulator [Pyxidicoccus parkwaysis]
MKLDLEALRTFVKVAELASFTRAAEQLGLAKARVSLRVKQLEGELGARLFQRSTRSVRLTGEGEQLLVRAHRLLAEADDVSTLFHSARSIRGRVRIDFPVTLARELIIPRLPELIARHPELELTVSATDRRVDAFREGFDCVLRGGGTGDPNLVGRPLGALRMMNCASPGYLRSHGTPRRVEDLDRHFIVHYSSTLGPETPSFEYPTRAGYREWPMRSLLTVNSVEAYHAACVAGLGIIQVPRAGMHARLAAGTLVEVLPEFPCAPMPVSLLHTHGRNVPRRVRVVMNWIAEVMGPYLEADAGRPS